MLHGYAHDRARRLSARALGDLEKRVSRRAYPSGRTAQETARDDDEGGADDAAARCLNLIDRVRDTYGAPESEPRHSDLASGRPWPIMAPDPDAEGNG